MAELQGRALALERDLRSAQTDLATARDAAVRVEGELARDRDMQRERLRTIEDAERRLAATFATASAEALDQNASRFLELAAARFETLKSDADGALSTRQAEITGVVSPMREMLARLEATLGTVERSRHEDRGQLFEHLASVVHAQQGLQSETGRLVRALQVPHVRGRWGELQLQRVVELAGMEPHVDVDYQASLDGDDGLQRPDLIVRLPGGRSIVVDAKAPITAYLEAISAADEETREARLRDHAARVRAHVAALGGKAYWSRLPSTPDFVVLFLPGESFFSAAVQHDPSLFEFGAGQRVFLSGPFTLLALLRTVAHGWSQEQLADNARTISGLGRELYDRLVSMTEHFAELRSRLQGAIDAHNRVVGSLESRVLPSARRFRDLGIQSSKELEALLPVDQTPRRLQAPDMAGLPAHVAPDAEQMALSDPLQPDHDD